MGFNFQERKRLAIEKSGETKAKRMAVGITWALLV